MDKVEIIKSIIRDIRNIKKKKPDREFILREAKSSHGLNESSTEALLGSMLKDSVLYINDEHSYFITAELRGKGKKSSLASVQKLESGCQTDEPVYAMKSQSPLSPCISTLAPDASIFEAMDQMAWSISELNRLLQDEGARSLCLLEENQKLPWKVLNMQKPALPKSLISSVTPDEISNNRPIEIKPTTAMKGNSSNKEHNTPSKTNSKKSKGNNKHSAAFKVNTNENIIKSRQKNEQNTAVKASSDGSNSRETNTVNKLAAAQHEASISGTDNQGEWPNNTVLIAGDSMLSNILENTLSQRYHTKVRCFKGSTIVDLYDYLKPLIKKKPHKIILVI